MQSYHGRRPGLLRVGSLKRRYSIAGRLRVNHFLGCVVSFLLECRTDWLLSAKYTWSTYSKAPNSQPVPMPIFFYSLLLFISRIKPHPTPQFSLFILFFLMIAWVYLTCLMNKKGISCRWWDFYLKVPLWETFRFCGCVAFSLRPLVVSVFLNWKRRWLSKLLPPWSGHLAYSTEPHHSDPYHSTPNNSTPSSPCPTLTQTFSPHSYQTTTRSPINYRRRRTIS